MKRICSLLLTAALMLGLAAPSYAASTKAQNAANTLYEMGLFSGTGTDKYGNPTFDLDRTPTRQEAITMLVAMLGKSEEAKQGTWYIPFTDVADWAKPYVGYAYANGMTSGTSATTYGADQPVTASQYLTFALTALGYKSGTDFQWDKAWELSDQIGLTHGEHHSHSSFCRGDVAIISLCAQSIPHKNSHSHSNSHHTSGSSSKELPDLTCFLNTQGTSPSKSDGGLQYGFKELPLDCKDTLESELLTLLQQDRYQLKLIDSHRNTLTEKTYTDLYSFTYTGSGSGMDPLNTDLDDCHVVLALKCFTKKQTLTVTINYSKGFELTDPGQKTSLSLSAEGSGSGSGSGSNWNPSQPDYTKLPCLTCDGDGDCTRCDGYGYLIKNGIRSDCTRCSSGNCPTCGGSGTR